MVTGPALAIYWQAMLTPDPKYPELRRRRFRPIPVRMLVPNVITLLAICAGLTAIRLSIEGRMDLPLPPSYSRPCWTGSTAVSRA